MHYLDNRKSEHSGFPSSTATSIKNGVFTNPQSKSHINNKRRNSRAGYQEGHSNTFREEYPLSVRSLSKKKHGISKSSHSKRKSSITYLNKQNNLTSRNNRAFIDEIEIQHEHLTFNVEGTKSNFNLFGRVRARCFCRIPTLSQ